MTAICLCYWHVRDSFQDSVDWITMTVSHAQQQHSTAVYSKRCNTLHSRYVYDLRDDYLFTWNAEPNIEPRRHVVRILNAKNREVCKKRATSHRFYAKVVHKSRHFDRRNSTHSAVGRHSEAYNRVSLQHGDGKHYRQSDVIVTPCIIHIVQVKTARARPSRYHMVDAWALSLVAELINKFDELIPAFKDFKNVKTAVWVVRWRARLRLTLRVRTFASGMISSAKGKSRRQHMRCSDRRTPLYHVGGILNANRRVS